MTTETAALELREQLSEIAAVEACAGCECLLGIVAQALADLRRLPGDEARDAEDEMNRLLVAGEKSTHGCLGCDPCLPVEPYRCFSGALHGAGALGDTGVPAPDDGAPARAAAAACACLGGGCAGCC